MTRTPEPDADVSAAHDDPARRFVAGEVERRASLSRAELLEEFAGRAPVVVAGGARGSTPVERWTPEHLVAVAGDAELALLSGVYEPDERHAGYPAASEVRTTLRELIEALLSDDASLGYLFNNPSSVVRTNDARAEFEISWKEGANPGLAALDAELELPELVRADELVHASIIVGGARHAAPLHYDLGGEAKVLVQVFGRKRVLLFHPDQARFLSFPGWFDAPQPYRVPHAADVDVHRPDLERFPELARARCLETVLEPGDVLYWPSFWPHDVRNLDRLTLAVSCSIAELPASSLLMREALGLLGRLVLDAQGEHGPPSSEVERVFRDLERRVMADDLRGLRTFWGWHARVMGS